MFSFTTLKGQINPKYDECFFTVVLVVSVDSYLSEL